MRACSEDLRKKIVVAVERGMPKAQAARLFDVSLPSVKLLEDRPSGRPPRAQEESRAAPHLVFEAYVERVLAPTLRKGQVVVLDNLSAHKGERVKQLIEGRGCELLYLPPYSPDLNPIEEAFSKIKGLVRKAQARTREALVEAISKALCAITSGDSRGFLEHCGYRIS